MVGKQSHLFYMSPTPSINTHRCLDALLLIVVFFPISTILTCSDYLPCISVERYQLQLPCLPFSLLSLPSHPTFLQDAARIPKREPISPSLAPLSSTLPLSFSLCLSRPFFPAICHLATVSAMLLGSESSLAAVLQ